MMDDMDKAPPPIKGIYDLPLHDRMMFQTIGNEQMLVIRVAGGWIYLIGSPGGSLPVFVPYSEEFKPEVKVGAKSKEMDAQNLNYKTTDGVVHYWVSTSSTPKHGLWVDCYCDVEIHNPEVNGILQTTEPVTCAVCIEMMAKEQV